MNLKIKGILEASVAYISFGLVPLFTIPVVTSGMSQLSVLVYQFGIAAVIILAIALFTRTKLSINVGDIARIFVLALLYTITSLCLITGYKYMSSGIATTLFFSFPVWTTLIMAVFFRERITFITAIAILLAVGGVYLFSGSSSGYDASIIKGVIIELTAGLSFAIYMVIIPRMRTSRMNIFKVNFYILLFATVIISAYSLFVNGSIEPIKTSTQAINLVLLGLLPTAVSNVGVVMALKNIPSTMVSILGGFEPLTAVIVGIFVFHEAFTLSIAIGIMMILAAVVLLVRK